MNVRDLETIDFRSLSIFVSACQTLNLTQSADQLGLPKSTVSKELSRLEKHLQTQLLERSTRRIQITESGKLVYQRAFQLIEEFRNLREDVQQMEQQVQGQLRISAPPALGEFLSSEILPGFLAQWPKVRIALELSYAYEDLFSQGIDLAFRVGQIIDDRLIARQIGNANRILVASPQYLADKAPIDSPQQLFGHNCLRFQYSPGESSWTLSDGEQTEAVSVCGNFCCGNVQALKSAALAGAGIAQMPILSLNGELESGRLVRVLPQWQVPPMPIYLVYRSGVARSCRMRAFLEYMEMHRGRFETTEAPAMQ